MNSFLTPFSVFSAFELVASVSLAFCIGGESIAQSRTGVFQTEPEMLQEHGAGEGPAWHRERGLLTSAEGDIHLRTDKGAQSVFMKGAGTNGLLYDRDGQLLMCQNVLKRISRLHTDGTLTVLADNYNGSKFNQPNDLTTDSKNRIYFTDPRYGSRDAMEMLDESGRTVEGVYRIDPDGTLERIIAHEVDRPNGVLVTPDDSTLFVADNHSNTPGAARKLYRFVLRADGTVDKSSQTLVYDWGTGRGPDGMAIDQKGWLYVAGGRNVANLPNETANTNKGGIYVFDEQGARIAFLPIPRDEVTNCQFGGTEGRTLFITAGGSLWTVQTVNKGVVPGK